MQLELKVMLTAYV